MKLVEIRALPPTLAEMTRDILAQEGIQSFLDPADEAYMRIGLGPAARPVRIMVDENDEGKALEVLLAWDSGEVILPEGNESCHAGEGE